MTKHKWLIGIFALLLGLVPAAMADTLQVNMVQASNEGEAKVDDSLKPFLKLLQSNLPFKRFIALDKRSVALPASEPIVMKEYQLTCSGSAGDMTVAVSHRGREVMNSKVSIEKGKPLVVGGFPDGDNRILLILSVAD